MSEPADNRSVSTDALETLGSIIDETQARDAIHLAVEPVIAAEKLYPGQDVGFKEGGVGISNKPVGIVDPFLRGIVHPGQRFWLVVYPRQITSLRHVWTHPDFEETKEGRVVVNEYHGSLSEKSTINTELEDKKEESKIWIAGYANKVGMKYDELLELADDNLKDGSFETGGSEWEGLSTDEEFWDHYEVVRGVKVKLSDRGDFFNCSC